MSGWWKPFLPIFSDITATKSNFPSSEDIIFSESFILGSGNLFSVQWKQHTSVQSFFSAVWNYREPILKEKLFPASGNYFLKFFLYSGNVFFNECLVPGTGNWFSGLYKLFLIYFLQRHLPVKAFFRLVERCF